MENEKDHEQKELTVYLKNKEAKLILLTASGRYGSDCSRAPNES